MHKTKSDCLNNKKNSEHVATPELLVQGIW